MTYIEFYGLPGTGKTTFAGLINKSMNRDAEWKYSPKIVFKTFSAQFKFKMFILKKILTSFDFFKYSIRRPLHLLGFMKAMSVRFLIAFRHENSGYFISDHGLVQTLSQNHYFLKEMLKDKKFSLDVLRLLPKTIEYVYLKSNIKKTLERELKRSKCYEYPYDYLSDCEIFFEFVKKQLKSKTISTDNPMNKIKKDLNKVLNL